jgi:uncharacterized membrane protein|tara:strand:- start:111 stop:284 length:174 start_codon:yes stop_codon:yes gene_type:complete
MIKRKKSSSQKEKIIQEIKNRTPKIVFTAKNLVVTLRSRSQLNKWLEIYPDGKYVIS